MVVTIPLKTKKTTLNHIKKLIPGYLLCVLLTSLLATSSLFAQDDLDALLDGMEEEKVEYVTSTFKSVRIVNLHSVEKVPAKTIEFRISHRFGDIKGGFKDIFGLDNASIRFSFDYGINDWIMVGVGRSTYQKTYDGYVKASLLRQSKGKRNMPISLLALVGMGIRADDWPVPDRDYKAIHRFSYFYQLIIGRKFSKSFSFQLAPTLVHRNLVTAAADANLVPALGFGGRVKISNRVALTADYFLRIPTKSNSPTFENYQNSLSLGIDLETGGHVFQLHFTNSRAMIEKGVVAETSGTWYPKFIDDNGDGIDQDSEKRDVTFYFGFNITRQFTVGKRKHK